MFIQDLIQQQERKILEEKHRLEDLKVLQEAINDYKEAKSSLSFWVWSVSFGYATGFSEDICDLIKTKDFNI